MAPSARQLLIVVAAHLLGLAAGGPPEAGAFEAFLREHGKSYAPGSAEYQQRRRLFERRRREIEGHNAQPGQLWTARVNRLADFTDEELGQLRNYRRQAQRPQEAAAPAQFLSRSRKAVSLAHLPQDFNWQHLTAMREVQDQGGCGSCWAFASSTALRAHSELFQADREFSVQEIVSCTPNPMQCGGDGGCKGATAELAMEYVMQHGCATAGERPYHGDDGACPTAAAGGQSLVGGQAPAQLQAAGGAAFGMTGYRKLPENQLEPVLLALYELGPVAVSVAAGYRWNFYHGGIMSACSQNAVIDHAVTLVGYGRDPLFGVKYYLIQNSWGKHWGENGFIRLFRHDDEQERSHCGWDNQPQIGSGCNGGPPRVRICGSCGILYDAVVPKMALSPQGLWARSGQKQPDSSDTLLSLLRNSTRRPSRARFH